MNIETDHIIRLLTSLFNERERESGVGQFTSNTNTLFDRAQ